MHLQTAVVRFTRVTLLLALGISLDAATLTVGTVSIGPGQTGNLSVALTNAGAQISALQFDVAYNSSVMSVTMGVGASATTAQKSIATNPLVAGSQRAILSGAQTLMGDGAVANLTVTVLANAPVGNYPVTITNLVAADITAALVPLTGANGSVTVANTYLVGDVFPHTSDAVGHFGGGPLDIFDLVETLFAINNIVPLPAACTDRFDAMDTFPADTPTVRGGDGALGIFDLILELFRVNNLDLSRPVRASKGGVCSPPQAAQSAIRTSRAAVPLRNRPVDGALMLGAPQNAGTAIERVPVYLDARRNLVRFVLTAGIGDQKSQLHFEPAGTPPSMAQDKVVGAIAVAWLDGMTVRAGERLLLGYVTGPAGMSGNLKILGHSSGELDGYREVTLEPATPIQ